MALVPAKCTECGAAIEVDETKENGVCEHCGTEFITEKVITNYVTNITNVDNSVNIYLGAASKTTKTYLKEAQAHFDLEEYVEALICCDNALQSDIANFSNYFVCAEFLGEMYIKMLEQSPYIPIILDENYKDYDYRYFKINRVIDNYEKAIKLCKNEEQKTAMSHAMVEFGNKANKLILNGSISRLESRLKKAYKTSSIEEIKEKVKSSPYKIKTIEEIQKQNKINEKHNDLFRLVKEGKLTEEEALKKENDFITQMNQPSAQEIEKLKIRKKKEYEEQLKEFKKYGPRYRVYAVLMVAAFIACMVIPVVRKFIFGHWYMIIALIAYIIAFLCVWNNTLAPTDNSNEPIKIEGLKTAFDNQEYTTNLETKLRVTRNEYVSTTDSNYTKNRCAQLLKELYLVRQECESNKIFYAAVCAITYSKEVDDVFYWADWVESAKNKDSK